MKVLTICIFIICLLNFYILFSKWGKKHFSPEGRLATSITVCSLSLVNLLVNLFNR